MKRAFFRFDETLRPLLQRPHVAGTFEFRFNGPQSLKHLVESVGVPHTEIGSLRAGHVQVAPGYLVRDGDVLEIDGTGPAEAADEEPRFVLDGHLGRLNSHLRMLGLDCLYRNDYMDDELVQISLAEARLLLTRDRRLLMRKSVTRGCLLRSLDPAQQLGEVVRRYRLRRWIRPFQRCIRCNALLRPVPKEQILDRLEPLTRLYFEEFRICPACGQIYWKGSHFEHMLRTIRAVEEGAPPSPREDV